MDLCHQGDKVIWKPLRPSITWSNVVLARICLVVYRATERALSWTIPLMIPIRESLIISIPKVRIYLLPDVAYDPLSPLMPLWSPTCFIYAWSLCGRVAYAYRGLSLAVLVSTPSDMRTGYPSVITSDLS